MCNFKREVSGLGGLLGLRTGSSPELKNERAGQTYQSLVKKRHLQLTARRPGLRFTLMETLDFDQLLGAYKQAVDQWVEAIRTEEGLATADHSMKQMELWDDAGFKLHDAELKAKKARDAYKNALRKKNYGF
jgi:hypothetical protein